MLREVFEHTGLEPNRAAALLGIDPEIFGEWLANQREIPSSIRGLLSNVVGLDLEPYLARKVPTQEAAANTPAIWYRFRGDNVVAEDREFVLLVRRLGFFMNELEDLTGARAVGWKSLFSEIRQGVDIQAPPRVQGIQAAKMFRESRSLSTGATGIGEAIRGNLRAMGVLVIETAVPQSNLEGCCFYVGSRPSERPCIFANNHHTTWFRRNEILMHEIAHAIFDAESAGASLDFRDTRENLLMEERADAFAQEMLVPRQVLIHVAQARGVSWRAMDAEQLAQIIASTHVEQRLVLRAALESNLISSEEHEKYLALRLQDILQQLTEHALSTDDYIRARGSEEAQKWVGKRATGTADSTMSLKLPVHYIKAILEAYKSNDLSRGKAAEMLMIDENEFTSRFPCEIAPDPYF